MIVLVEPECRKYEHSDVNSALILLLNKLHNNVPLILIGDESHTSIVNKTISDYKINIKYTNIKLPLRNGNVIFRIISNYIFILNVIRFCKIYKAKSLFFTSITIPGILVLKFFCFFNPEIKITCVGHTILETIYSNNKFNYLKIILNNFNFKNFTLLIYGYKNDKEILKYLPKSKNNVLSFDLPYIFNYMVDEILDHNKILIGSLGIARIDKGTERFFKFSQIIKSSESSENINFIHIGQVFEIDYTNYINSIDFPSPKAPINRDIFINIGKKIHYSIFCYNYNSYRLIVSASFYDSILLEKPIIAFENQFFRKYFDRFGDIGYLVKTEKDMLSLIYSLNNNFDIKRYNQQCNNIKIAKAKLSIESIAFDLKQNNISFL